MTVGGRLRQLLGPATDPVARWYRKWYVDLDDFGRTLSRFGPVERVVEVGCGDGHLTERIVAEMPGPTSWASTSPTTRAVCTGVMPRE